MYLFFDTETTGLPKNWKAPITDLANWPRLVQIAWLTYDLDGRLQSGNNFIVRPEQFTIPPDASRIHGISTEKAMKEGSDLAHVLGLFQEDLISSEFLVAHNFSFDEKIVAAEFLRCDIPNHLPSKKSICTMKSGAQVCKIPGPYGFKWPKLPELHQTLFNTPIPETHDAAKDIAVTAKCFWELKRIGKI